MKKFAALVLFAVCAGGAWFYFPPSKLPVPAAFEIPEKYVSVAEARDIDFSVELSGDVTPDFQLDVKPEVGGKLKALHVEPGQQVKKGQPLCEIDDTDLMNERRAALTEIEGAKLEMDRNRRHYDRGKELSNAKLISSEVFDNLSVDFEISKNRLAKAQRQVETVDDKLRKTKLMASMDGTVLNVNVIEGQVVVAAASVNSGTTLMTIADLSRLLVATHVNQVDVSKLQLKQKIKLNAESLKDMDFNAAISFIAPVATVKNGVKGFDVQALIDHPDSRLRPGMTVNMVVPIANVQQALSVPIAAVFRGDDETSKVVYVRHGESTEKREVTVGVSNLDFAEIKTGIKAGEEILLVEPRTLENKS